MPEVDIVEEIVGWPQAETGAPEPEIRLWGGRLILSYITVDDQFAVIIFPACCQVICGPPNDEALAGHSLYAKGLRHYGIFRIQNSSRIEALRQMNTVHPNHDDRRFLQGLEHYVFTFRDDTLECIIRNDERNRPVVQVFETAEAAKAVMY